MANTSISGLPLDLPLREARDAFERVYFEHHIAKDGGNMSRVAQRLKVERTNLLRIVQRINSRRERSELAEANDIAA